MICSEISLHLKMSRTVRFVYLSELFNKKKNNKKKLSFQRIGESCQNSLIQKILTTFSHLLWETYTAPLSGTLASFQQFVPLLEKT